jgi:hypothetical protein
VRKRATRRSADCRARRPKTREQERALWDADRTKELGEERGRVVEGLEESAPFRGVGAEDASRSSSTPHARMSGGSVVERMREGKRRIDPFEAELLERDRREERREDAERMDGRTHVVDGSRGA